MKTEHIVEELKQAARQLGLRVRVDTGRFRGGRCKVGEDEYVVLNRRHLPEAHLVILAESLKGLPLETVYLRPAVREALDEVWRRREALEAEEVDAED